MKQLILLLFILIFSLKAFPQVSDPKDPVRFVPGELIVQLNMSAPVLQQDATLLCQAFQGTGLAVKKLLSARLQIWLLSFDTDSVEQHAMLEAIKLHSRVNAAQFNHFVTFREVIPDDPYFPDQWALMNTGQLGGTPNADIDATRAWEITTGGMTSLGDTIVLAIVDQGFDVNQVDIHYWKNYQEIPSNGIDDDMNGYIDDYDGWNSYASNGQIPVNNHGTHVAGIAGAIGNNGTGVTGVNWNVQIMPVATPPGDEARVVEAYGYVLEMRARYNDTDGEEGAFVVATNASFGVDQGDPDDYPIWGAIYDSLGMLGVLSVGATANANWNIDQVGDIPTAFPSDFLITVTNTNPSDLKFSPAAWGPVTIDLGSPGYMIRSTISNNQFDYKSGTSMSAPFVTGAIGLIFSAADEATMQANRIKPDSIALVFKSYILNSVDKLVSLDSITLTEGRLNLYKTLLLQQGEPILQQEPVTIEVEAAPDSQTYAGLVLFNRGNSTAHYTIWTDPPVSWLPFDQTNDSVEASCMHSVRLTVVTEGLGPGGDYYTDLYLSYENDQSIKVPVHLFVNPFISVEDTEPDPGATIRIYPNPSTDRTWLAIDLKKDTRVEIEMNDMSGRRIWNLPQQTLNSGSHLFRWDGHQSGGQIATGFYICMIRLDYQLITRKIIRY
ncbi:MAG: S8 family peptidase [Bacteroidales bacterium]|nr:S8 family peptidase [Bacteroidales bacterium]